MSNLRLIHRARPAMGTLFEAVLLGDDDEHLTAVAEAALDEVTRLEHLLSRFDPRSEISRVNREAAHGPLLVDVEMFGILQTCRDWWQRTRGYYDIACAASGGREPPGPHESESHERESQQDQGAHAPRLPSLAHVQLNDAHRTVHFTHPDVRLDLGGFGKGYALDGACEILRAHNVTRALLHGGTSSILTLGLDQHDRPWPIGIRNPWPPEQELSQVRLSNQGFSSSAALGHDQKASDLVDPVVGRPLADQAACCVIAPTALEAEILSTALLSMGKDKARAYTGVQVAWISGSAESPVVEWF